MTSFNQSECIITVGRVVTLFMTSTLGKVYQDNFIDWLKTVTNAQPTANMSSTWSLLTIAGTNRVSLKLASPFKLSLDIFLAT